MGMGSELLDEIRVVWLVAEDCIQDMYDRKTWKTADGTEMKIRHMTDSHINNCIAHLERGDWSWRADYLELFHKERAKRIKRMFR